MRNVVLDWVRKILQAYIKNSDSTAYYFEITKLYIVLEVLQNDVKYLAIFQKKHSKKPITQYFLAENKSLCFLVELSKQSQNLLQLNC